MEQEKGYNRNYRDLVQWMVRNSKEVLEQRQEFQSRLVKKRFTYGDGIMQTTLVPIFLKRKSLNLIRYTSEVLDNVLEKMIRYYFELPRVREHFPDHFDVPREWMMLPSGYARATTINRHDLLFDGKNLKYIEFNTDNPGGKGWTDLLLHAFRANPLYKDLIDFSEDVDRPVLEGLYRAMLEAWQQWGRGGARPRVAVVSVGAPPRGDEEIVRDYFIERGIEGNVLDARALEHRQGRLWSNGVAFDLVLRSIKAGFFLKYPRELREFHQAVAAGDVCMVNAWRCLFGAEKSMLSFLTNPLNHDLFTAEEVKVIKNHVPWTRTFNEADTLGPDGEEISLGAFMMRNRERLVIKPTTGAGGYGVAVGPTTDPVEWRGLVEDHLGSTGWIVQDYVPVPSIDIPVIQQNKVMVQSRFLNLSPYVFGGRYVGTLGRVSSKDVINVSAGGGMIPVFALRDDNSRAGTLGEPQDDTPGEVAPPTTPELISET